MQKCYTLCVAMLCITYVCAEPNPALAYMCAHRNKETQEAQSKQLTQQRPCTEYLRATVRWATQRPHNMFLGPWIDRFRRRNT